MATQPAIPFIIWMEEISGLIEFAHGNEVPGQESAVGGDSFEEPFISHGDNAVIVFVDNALSGIMVDYSGNYVANCYSATIICLRLD